MHLLVVSVEVHFILLAYGRQQIREKFSVVDRTTLPGEDLFNLPDAHLLGRHFALNRSRFSRYNLCELVRVHLLHLYINNNIRSYAVHSVVVNYL